MRLFGIFNGKSDIYVSICPGHGYVITETDKIKAWGDCQEVSFGDHPYSYIGKTQAGLKFPVAVGQQLGLMRTVFCFVPDFPGNRGEAGMAAERFYESLQIIKPTKANIDLEYQDVDFILHDGTMVQVKLDLGIKKYGNVFLEVAKTSVKTWAHKELSK